MAALVLCAYKIPVPVLNRLGTDVLVDVLIKLTLVFLRGARRTENKQQ